MISIGVYVNMKIVVKVGGVFGIVSGLIDIYYGCADLIDGEFAKDVIQWRHLWRL